ncbi:ADP-ribose glycohydrolase OARD1-like [Aphis craccivora]|uniref:ADP-ribose glycohydrolase OARD1-like n=1 Tax=Aphis craccivora TaxID=307492 RepID=A0A6G0VKG0_APHCR|nr:ADP-ribose glycohydrolase OARD1-like [Aphis craccivora]
MTRQSRNRDKSPYSGKSNYKEKIVLTLIDTYNNKRYRDNSRERDNNKDRSYSRERNNSYDRTRNRSKDRGNNSNTKQYSRENIFKKRIVPKLYEKSEYLTRETNNINTNTDTSKFNKDKQTEKNNYIQYVENWYKSLNSNKLINKEVNNEDEKIIENIVRISSLNPLNEFQKFLLSNNNRTNFLCNYSEQIVDIFSLPNDVAIGHCISQCLTMSKGIALQFRNRFNNVQNLITQHKKTTEIAYLKNGRQWILYLITNNKYYDKSVYSNIFNTLINTREFCIENNISTLALPKICTREDKKDWKTHK